MIQPRREKKGARSSVGTRRASNNSCLWSSGRRAITSPPASGYVSTPVLVMILLAIVIVCVGMLSQHNNDAEWKRDFVPAHDCVVIREIGEHWQGGHFQQARQVWKCNDGMEYERDK